MYAVVDVETTGLHAGRHDRIVEVAVVQVDGAGRVEDTWTTLVNPRRDLGPQYVHGIAAADARKAPTFEQIAGHLAGTLRGRVLVAHNLPFDAMFLAAEYRRIGGELPQHRDVGLCTMSLAGQYLPSNRSLADCCAIAGIPLTNAHCALDDARAAAALLSYYLDRAGQPVPWSGIMSKARDASWPDLPVAPFDSVVRSRPDERTAHFLSRLVARLPRIDHPEADSYLDLLDRALVDRFVSATEADALVAYAGQLGLGRLEVSDLHQRYLEALAVAAWEDGVVTDAEHDDLVEVAILLGLDVNDVDWALKSASSREHPSPPRYGRFTLAPGDIVALTGAFSTPKDELAAEITAAGLAAASGVTKKTKLLVAADVDSMSGKAETARRYAIPIVGEAALRRLLDDCVTRGTA